MFNDPSFNWNEAIKIFERKVFASNVESTENTDQFSKDETLIEEKAILTQELILGSMKCLVKLILSKMIFLCKIMINLPKMKSLVMKKSLMN